MKRNILIVLALGLLLTYGCQDIKFGNDFLEKAPGVDITRDTIFSNINSAQNFLWGGYKTLPYGINATGGGSANHAYKYDCMGADVLECLSDFCQSYIGWSGSGKYYNGSYNASSEDWHGTKYGFTEEESWTGIRIAYIFIQNIDKVPNVDLATKKQLKAEARMIIAVHYTDMYRNLSIF